MLMSVFCPMTTAIKMPLAAILTVAMCVYATTDSMAMAFPVLVS